MIDERETTRIVRSWLESGATSLPDRVLDGVLDQLPATRQRRALWPAWRFQQMSNPFKIAVTAMVVGVIALIGVDLAPRSSGVGGEIAAPPVALPENADLEAGTTYFMDDAWGPGSPRLILTVPAAGWHSGGIWNIQKWSVGLTPWRVDNLKADPCRSRTGGDLEPPVGPTVDDLATALMAQAGGAAVITDVTIDERPGKRVELSLPAGLDIATCEGPASPEQPRYARWLEGVTPGGHIYGNGQTNAVYILDVDGLRAVIDTNWLPGTSEETKAELEALVGSIRIEPVAPAPSPSAAE